MSARSLENRVAVVTGASRNIGRAIALELAREGAAVVVNARSSSDEAESVAAEIRAQGGKAVSRLADVTDPAQAKALADAAVEAFGRLDCLVNNAAVRRETPLADLDLAEWREVMAIILDGPFLMAKAALPHLMASDMASIVNIGGLSAHTGASNRAHVVAAKSGLVGLTRALAHELAGGGVTVNCVSPGLIDTVRGRSAPGSPSHHAVHSTLTGRRGKPQEIAALVRFLAGPDGRYVTGQTIQANGGAYFS